jgi:uncharacterized protein (DUF58 family)
MLTSRGLVTSVLGGGLAIAGAAYGVEEFVLFAAAVLTLFVSGAVVIAWRVLASKRLEVRVAVPVAEVLVGQRASAELRLSNRGTSPTPPLRCEDPDRKWSLSFPGLRAREAGTLTHEPGKWNGNPPRRAVTSALGAEHKLLGDPPQLPGLGRGAGGVLKVDVPTARRGLLTLESLSLWVEDPFRLIAWRVAETQSAHVLVCPRPEPWAGALRKSAGGDGTLVPDASEQAEAGGVQGGYEFRAIRPYIPGDRMTRLHWPAFARSGELAVRDFVEPVSGCVCLLVDLRPSSHREGSIEAVLSRAAAIGSHALECGELVELCTNAGDRLEIAPGTQARQNLLRALAVLGPVSAPMAAAVRWRGTSDGAVWAPSSNDSSEVVLLTTSRGADSALPERLATRAETLVV